MSNPTDPFRDMMQGLKTLLTTDDRDAGCDTTFELMHRYCELVIAGRDPEDELPGITVHLRTCGPCAADFQSLLALAGNDPH